MTNSVIICVDDEEIILNSLGEQLKRNLGKNYTIELASNAQEALELCQELTEEKINIALVISDQIMPYTSGDEFLVKLHEIYPKTLKILLTGQAETMSLKNIVNAASLYRYITKPWDETDLILTVKEALRCYGQEEKLIHQNNLLKQINQKLSKSLNLILATFEAAGDGILILDNQGKIITYNHKFSSLWSLPDSVNEDRTNCILNLVFSQLSEPLNCLFSTKEFKLNTPQDDILKLENGTILESSFQNQILEGEIVGRVWRVRDVTAKEEAKALAEYKANHDTVTQLPKRSILTCQLIDAIAKAEQNSQMVAVMFVELDRFKIVSDTLGHQVGDCLLKEVVKRLKNCVRDEDAIARWGRDEFTLLLPYVYQRQSAGAIAQRILNTLKSPFTVQGKSIYLSSYIGIAVYPEHGTNAEMILKNADAALSQAQKLKHNNYRYYDPSLTSKAHKLLTTENLLRSALERNEFTVHYQPIVNISTGKIAKMEALLRWENAELGVVSPNTFIPLAEENGLIIPIGEWVLRSACMQNRKWQEKGLEPIKISVNLSVRQFQQPNLVSVVSSILQQTQLPSSYLEIEITESITMSNTNLAKAILRELHAMGISLSMDDFGTGYSSLSYLKQFPFQTLKIDRYFIKDLHSSPEDLAIVEAIITLGKGLNLNIVAEGVETIQLRNLLQSLGCEYMQGYLFSKPVTPHEATQLLEVKNFAIR